MLSRGGVIGIGIIVFRLLLDVWGKRLVLSAVEDLLPVQLNQVEGSIEAGQVADSLVGDPPEEPEHGPVWNDSPSQEVEHIQGVDRHILIQNSENRISDNGGNVVKDGKLLL